MLTNDYHVRLEPGLDKLYELHRERADKIDWSYHEYIPWDKAQDFRRVPWQPDQVTLPLSLVTAVETALLTEVNLPWFTTHLAQTFKGSIAVLRDFIHTWTSEEDQHSNLLETYLIVTRSVDPHHLHKIRKQVVEGGFELNYTSPFEAMAYTTMQELATMVFYSNVARVANQHDPELSALLRRLAKDETLHYAFYREAIKLHLEIEPNYCFYLDHVIKNFAMPGANMPDFEDRMTTIASEANYGPLEYFDQVLDVIVEAWGIADLRPRSQEAEQSRLNILKYHDRLKRLRDRAMKRKAVQ